MRRLGLFLAGSVWFAVSYSVVHWLLWRINLPETTGDSSTEAAAIARFHNMLVTVFLGFAAACVGVLLSRITKQATEAR
jgi:hypothetical protein